MPNLFEALGKLTFIPREPSALSTLHSQSFASQTRRMGNQMRFPTAWLKLTLLKVAYGKAVRLGLMMVGIYMKECAAFAEVLGNRFGQQAIRHAPHSRQPGNADASVWRSCYTSIGSF